MKQRTFPILAVLLLAAALSGCQSTAAGDSAGLSIHFIDPGQTSSALLLCGGQAMLIDGGSAERGSQVAGYLSQQGITYLDYVVCTSADETHMGGLSGPLYTCAVGQVLSPVEDAGSPVFADFRRYTEAQGLSPAVPEAGSVFPPGGRPGDGSGDRRRRTDALPPGGLRRHLPPVHQRSGRCGGGGGQ